MYFGIFNTILDNLVDTDRNDSVYLELIKCGLINECVMYTSFLYERKNLISANQKSLFTSVIDKCSFVS